MTEKEALDLMIKRLTAAGLVERGAVTDEKLWVKWTSAGAVEAFMLRSVMDKIGYDISKKEMHALATILGHFAGKSGAGEGAPSASDDPDA